MPRKTWLIGADPACDIVVSESTVSSRHCLLSYDGEHYELQDLESTNGVYVNGKRVNHKSRIARADRVTLGLNTPLPWPMLDRQETLQLKAEVLQWRDAVQGDLSSRTISLGRDKSCDIQLANPEISSRHAELTFLPNGQVEIRDLNSTNGTFIGMANNQIQKAEVGIDEPFFLGPNRFTAREIASLAGIPIGQLNPTNATIPRISSRPAEMKGKPTSQLNGILPLVSMAACLGLFIYFWQGARLDKQQTKEPPRTGEQLQNLNADSLHAAADASPPASNSSQETLEFSQLNSPPKSETRTNSQAASEKFVESSLGRVICQDLSLKHALLLGTCIAIDEKTFLTTATIAKLIKEMSESGFPNASILLPDNSNPIPIDGTKFSPEFLTHDTEFEKLAAKHRSLLAEFEEGPPSEELKSNLTALTSQVIKTIEQKMAWDIAILEAAPASNSIYVRLKTPPDLHPSQKVELTAFPSDLTDSYIDLKNATPPQTVNCRVELAIPDQAKVLGLFQAGMEISKDVEVEQSFLGGIVHTPSGELAGIFTRFVPPPQNGTAPATSSPSVATPSQHRSFQFIPIDRVKKVLSQLKHAEE